MKIDEYIWWQCFECSSGGGGSSEEGIQHSIEEKHAVKFGYAFPVNIM